MGTHVRKVRRASSRRRGPPRFLTVVLLLAGLSVIVLAIDFFYSPKGGGRSARDAGGPTGDEVGGDTNGVRHPRSHIIY